MNEIELTAAEISKGVAERTKKYTSLSFLEQYALYMGVAQLLELRLKQILVRDFGFQSEQVENYSLGVTLDKLSKAGMRDDFLQIAAMVKDDRNYIAHELLANKMIMESFNSKTDYSSTKNLRILRKATIEIEQLMFILEWNDEHGKWK